jgi:hypothetical protein
VLGYPPGVGLSTSHLRHLARHLAARRVDIGCRWRRLSPHRQALLVLAHLRCGDTYAQLAAGFGVGILTVYRFISRSSTAGRRRSCRSAAGHRKHGMNVQIITDPFGRLLWASPALPGAVHDLTAARPHGIIDALTETGIVCFADKGYQGAGGTVRVPFRGKHRNLPAGQRTVNVAHARIRAVGEQAIAALKGWWLLRKLRCSTTRITSVVKTILALHHASV